MGDPILRFDIDYIQKNAKSTNSPIIITNSDQTSDINFAEATDLIKGETKIADVTMK